MASESTPFTTLGIAINAITVKQAIGVSARLQLHIYLDLALHMSSKENIFNCTNVTSVLKLYRTQLGHICCPGVQYPRNH